MFGSLQGGNYNNLKAENHNLSNYVLCTRVTDGAGCDC